MNKIYFGIILLALLSSPLYAVWFLPGVGGKPTDEDRENYSQRASNFDGEIFHNQTDYELMTKDFPPDENSLSKKETKPKEELPVFSPEFIEKPGEKDFTLTWFGHSSLLIQFGGKNILIDPVFRKKLSPVSWIGVKRFTPCPVNVEDLPKIDLMILSHDHYDHLDYKIVKKLSDKVRKVIVPLGVECHLRKWGYDMSKVENMAWWEEREFEGLLIACTPAQHFSGRWLNDRNRTLWASWVLKFGDRQIFYNADSGFGPHYEEIHEKYGDFDFALMECGQYNSRWAKIHSFPEEGADAMKIIGAKLVMPIHWGAFVLSNHAWDDSVERFVLRSQEIDLPCITPKIGQTVNLNIEDLSPFQEKWWQGIK
ncbi:MAG: MBL fold metallo-hydrolase [Treponema sp.]|nr:MBL fold metallo-hydrolase [Treponema sp.]